MVRSRHMVPPSARRPITAITGTNRGVLSFALLALLPALSASACAATSSNSSRPVDRETPSAIRPDSGQSAYEQQLVESIVEALWKVPILRAVETAATCQKLVGTPLSVADKGFVVTSCGATLIANEPDPLWHVTAAWTGSSGVIVCATFNGRVIAAKPELAYHSVPHLSQSEILALLLFETQGTDSGGPTSGSPSNSPCNRQHVIE